MITWHDCIIKPEPALASQSEMMTIIDTHFQSCVDAMHTLPRSIIGRREKRIWLANRLFDIILSEIGNMGTLHDRRAVTASLYLRIRHGIRQWAI